MAEFKLVIAQKEGKSIQKELKSPEADSLVTLKIGDKITITNLRNKWHFEAVCTNGASYTVS